MVKSRLLRVILLLIVCTALLTDCGSVMTKNKFYGPITDDLQNQNYQAAVKKIEKAKNDNQYAKKDRLLYYLDFGLANHYALNHDLSIENLSLAEQSSEELFTKSVSRAALSLALNDNILEYSGEDYEILYSNLIKALDFMAENKFDDAFVEIRRSNEKLDLLETKYVDAAKSFKTTKPKDDSLHINENLSYDIDKVRFNNDAFGRYMSMHLYAAEGKMDDARLDYDMMVNAFETQPEIYNFNPPEVKFVPESGAILSVVGLAGLPPIKEAVNLRIRTDKDLDLVQVLYTDGPNKDAEYSHLAFPVSEDYYFKFSLPKLVSQPSHISRIKVWVDDQPVGELQLIEDVSQVAQETFRAKKSLIYFRTIARALFKGLAAHKAKQKIDKKHEGIGGWLMKAAVDVTTDVSENADLRCSHLLPGKVYVGDFELKPGVYHVRVDFISNNGVVIKSTEYPEYEIKVNGWNLIEAFSLN